MAIFNNKVKAAVLLVGIVFVLYGGRAVRGPVQQQSFGSGTVGSGPFKEQRAEFGTLPGHGRETYQYQRGGGSGWDS